MTAHCTCYRPSTSTAMVGWLFVSPMVGWLVGCSYRPWFCAFSSIRGGREACERCFIHQQSRATVLHTRLMRRRDRHWAHNCWSLCLRPDFSKRALTSLQSNDTKRNKKHDGRAPFTYLQSLHDHTKKLCSANAACEYESYFFFPCRVPLEALDSKMSIF